MTASQASPVELPDRVDPTAARVTMVATTADRLRSASFLDGRSPFATRTARTLALSELPNVCDPPVPTLLHVSFCGSTLLSRLIDVPGRTLVLREPRAQVDLADWRAALGAAAPSAEFTRALFGVTALLGRAVDGSRTAVKPTNWANVLLPDWAAARTAIAPVFLDAAPHAFATAVFRGGRDRLSFTMRAAVHFARMRRDGHALIAEATAASDDPLDRAARFAVLALLLQRDLFARAQAIARWSDDRIVASEALRIDPLATASRTAGLLGLPIDDPAIEARWHAVSGRDAKAPERAFTPGAEEKEDAAVLRHHGPRIAAAIRWSERLTLTDA